MVVREVGDNAMSRDGPPQETWYMWLGPDVSGALMRRWYLAGAAVTGRGRARWGTNSPGGLMMKIYEELMMLPVALM